MQSSNKILDCCPLFSATHLNPISFLSLSCLLINITVWSSKVDFIGAQLNFKLLVLIQERPTRQKTLTVMEWGLQNSSVAFSFSPPAHRILISISSPHLPHQAWTSTVCWSTRPSCSRWTPCASWRRSCCGTTGATRSSTPSGCLTRTSDLPESPQHSRPLFLCKFMFIKKNVVNK